MNGDNIMNQKGEQGGKILSGGDSFSEAADGHYATGFTVISDTELTSIESNYEGADTELVGVELYSNTFVAGVITQLTVASGLVAVHYGHE